MGYSYLIKNRDRVVPKQELFEEVWEDRFTGGPHEANFLKLDCSKLKNVFGWQPRWHVKEAVEYTVEWTKAYLEGQKASAYMDRQIKEFEKQEV